MTEAVDQTMPPGRSRWAVVARRFRGQPGAMAALAGLVLILALAGLGPLLWRIPPDFVDIRARNQGFSWPHPLGTDQLGRDMLARLMAGGRISLAVGFGAMALALGLGSAVGVLSGYVRRLDAPLMRLTELFMALPLLPLLLLMVSLFREPLGRALGPAGGTFLLVVAAIGATSWMPVARVVRGDVLALKQREFILAARSIGTPFRRMVLRHIAPNVMGSVLVAAVLGMANAIITESALSFLGLGFPPDFPTWGRLLFDAVDQMQQFPSRALLPGGLIALTVLAVNAVAEGLGEAMQSRPDRR